MLQARENYLEIFTMDMNFFHDIVWRRYVRMPYGHILDYAGKNGEAIFPTREECDRTMPNPRSWGLPIENGAFFTGLYTYALIEKYNNDGCTKTAEEINILINGLCLLQDVAKVDGFIARGVGDDGIGHYPMGAECQVLPWVLAMYAYYKSDLCKDKESVKARIMRVLMALYNYSWMIPCDEEGVFYQFSWLKATDYRGVGMLLFLSRLIYELSGDDKFLRYYEELADGVPEGSVFSRGEILSQGCACDMITWYGNQAWICTYVHLAVREMMAMDGSRRELYERGLYQNGVVALRIAGCISEFQNEAGGFDIDWRNLNQLWEDYGKDTARGTQISQKQFHYWHEHNVPRRRAEHEVLGGAVFASWIAITCGDKRIARRVFEILMNGVERIDWDEVHLSYAFVVESAMIFEKGK